ncbi:MAG TPA: PEGA domain-containing protein [Vicinamibacterales bacterium]|nr:PEGA domain-containing protein [Vicinamibacterales bacterium]
MRTRRPHRLLPLCGLAAGLMALTASTASAQPYWSPHPFVYGRLHGVHFPPWYGGPVYDVGSVRVQAHPREAQVFVDGYYVGIVDDFDGAFQRLKIPPGGHEIVLHLAGFRNASHRIYVQPRATFRLRARLEALPPGTPPAPRPTPDPSAPPPSSPGVPRMNMTRAPGR